MKKTTTRIVTAALIAAVYAVLTYLTAALGLAYGPIQFRISEAMFMLTAFTPYAVPGLTIGCVLANIASPYGLVDILIGALATLIASYISQKTFKTFGEKSLWILPLFPAIANGLLIGLEIALMSAEPQAFWAVFALSAAEVAIGELAVCYILGIPFYYLIKKISTKKL